MGCLSRAWALFEASGGWVVRLPQRFGGYFLGFRIISRVALMNMLRRAARKPRCLSRQFGVWPYRD